MSAAAKLRCAVYTRKSSEEGLDQEFNSLDAQREACVAYIASQAGLGWKLVPDLYDDGGISGGTMERPALQRLLQDIRNRRVDVVVVYKIDRLTRSLMDFSRIVEIFDASSVSFVSVTQAFNTTSSMGRLTLNVLLSFAQFEREVTAERIRDKIAASKRKGMWMGGRVPFGYEVNDRKLTVNAKQADVVRHLFCRYLELKSVLALADEFNRERPDLNPGEFDANGHASPPAWTRGKLYYLLSNQIYIGRIKHHAQHFDGEHEAIIETEQFAEVQALLAKQSQRRKGSFYNDADIHRLTGIVFDETGDRLSPAYAINHGRRYRYYVSGRLKNSRGNSSGGWRIPAHELESAAEHQLNQLLTDQPRLGGWIQLYTSTDHIIPALEAAKNLSAGTPRPDQKSILQSVFQRITVCDDRIVFQINRIALVGLLCGGALPGASTDESDVEKNDADAPFTINLPIIIKRRGVEKRIVIDSHVQVRLPDQNLVDLIARANFFLTRLTDGAALSIADVAKQCRVHRADISRILPLAFLSPRIVGAVLAGNQPADLTASMLARQVDLPLDWHNQEAALRF
jgi:site-specific DNA recombinase